MVDGKLKLCGVLGLENRQNLFLDDHGHWLTPFVPAVIRVAPFSLGQTSAGEKILLFIEDDEKIVTRNEGYPLFNEDGSDTQLIRSLSDLLIRIEKSNHIMDKACSFLSELELLESFGVKVFTNGFELGDGETAIGQNWLRINFQKFSELEDKVFLELKKRNILEIIYAHLFSLGSFQSLVRVGAATTRKDSSLTDIGSKIFDNKDDSLDFNFD